ncbi:MAG: squalene/phytoene synthase family protein [Caulobacteraceae bacterium]
MPPPEPERVACGDLDLLVRRADPDRWLASRFIADRRRRADVIALYAFDHELERARRVTSEARLAEIRLSWWRDVVDEIFAGEAVRAHPAAHALAGAVARHALPRAPIEAMIEARLAVLGRAGLDIDRALLWARDVGGSAAVLAARVLDPAARTEAAEPAGQVWGLVLLRRAGRADHAELDRAIAESLPRASAMARGLSARAFPAAACATLARARFDSGGLFEVERRLRLVRAVARGIL